MWYGWIILFFLFFFYVFSKIYFIFSRSATKYLKIVSNWKFPSTFARSIIPRHSSIKVKSFPIPNFENRISRWFGYKKISPETQKKRSILVKPHQLQGVFLANKPKRLCLICENVNFPATKISYFPWSYFFLMWKNKDHDKSVEKLDDKKQW